MKERVTLTIDENILKQVDETVDGQIVKNRSHAFELLVSKALGKNKLKKALILAGGAEKISGKVHPSMALVAGKPLLQHNIELLKKYGIVDIIISIGQNGAPIKKFFGDGNDFDVDISYVEEKNPMGTAGPLNLAKKNLTETFVMLNEDEIKEIDLHDMYEFHKEKGGFATISLTTVRDPTKYGVAVLNGTKITTFIEKPEKNNAPSNLISAGLYIMEPGAIDLVPNGFARLETDLFPKLASQEKLCGYSFSGNWLDANAFGRYKISIKEWKGIAKKT